MRCRPNADTFLWLSVLQSICESRRNGSPAFRMRTKAKGQSLWARALTIVLMLLLATASPLAHIVLPQAHADHRSSVDSGSQHAHHDTQKAMDTHLASHDAGPHGTQGSAGDCTKIAAFCSDCSYFCHPVFDIPAGYLIEKQGRLAIYSAPELLSEGVDPDVLPPPPKLS